MKQGRKKTSYIDDLIQSKVKIPGPSQYKAEMVNLDARNLANVNKFKFERAKKITMTASIFTRQKKDPKPGPDRYKFNEAWNRQQAKVPGTLD